MRIWLIIKIAAGLVVVSIATFTGMLSYHIAVKPISGPFGVVFAKIIPEAGEVLRDTKEEDFSKVLDAAEIPDFEPGDRAFQKAHELIALGKIREGREKLMAIINVFSSSPAAPQARRIVSMMNLDEVLSSDFRTGKTTYKVKSGDSYFAIAGRNETTLDMLMHLNDMMELKNLKVGDELVLMPLNYRVVIEPHRNSISLWQDAKFICDYPILNIEGVAPPAGTTTIASRRADLDGKVILPTAVEYRSTKKSISLKNPAIQILPYDEGNETPPRGIFIREADLEELFLLTRTGNTVEIKTQKK
jgi:hypothetical protein